MTILILGYFDRQNYGDDLFEYIWKRYFELYYPNRTIHIKNPDDNTIKLISSVDIIICGGGDLLNDYFIEKFRQIFKYPNCLNAKKYALGIGTPYTNLMPYLNMFDVVIHRDSDSSLFPGSENNNRKQLPDLVSLLLTLTDSSSVGGDLLPVLDDNENRKIGVFLAEPVFRNLEGKEIKAILELLEYLIEKDKYEIYLYPCQTGPSSDNDNIINKKIFNYLRMKCSRETKKLYLIETQPPMKNAINWFKQFYMTICTRFHAHVLSILANVPFVSSSPNRKVRNILKDNKIDDYIHENLIISYKSIRNNYDEFTKELVHICKSWKDAWLPVLSDLIDNCDKIESNRFDFKSLIDDNIQKITSILGNFNDDILFKADVISYIITGNMRSKYHYGLMEQLAKPGFNLINSIKWITNDWYLTRPIACNELHANNESQKFDIPRKYETLKIINKNDLENYHRSGWSYVMKYVCKLESPIGKHKIIFDSFLDKSFGWGSDFYKKIGLIPYKEKWMGVFHHTPNTDYTENNLVNCINNPLFIDSLPYCSGIIVMSEYIAEWLRSKNLGVSIIVIKHPTQFPDKKFDIGKWKYNAKKKVIQIGAWLRNSYAIYDLPAAPGIKKYVIKGKDMDNYFVNDIQSVANLLYGYQNASCNLSCKMHDNLSCNSNGNLSCHSNTICRAKTNKYITGLVDSIVEKHESVKMIKWVENDAYDELLSRNIVFINLVDASAVNTIIECIVRNTPILVNALPAVVEYLGPKYPFYYDNLDHAYLLMNDYDMIKQTFEYLQKMNKSDLQISYFMKRLMNHL